MCNLRVHIENITKHFGLPLIVAVNKFSADTAAELELVRSESIKFGAFDACISSNWELGGEGAVDLGKAVMRACKEAPNNFRLTYDLNESIKTKIEKIVKNIYRAAEVEYSELAEKKIKVRICLDLV